jgi:hypothetical protein
MIIHVLRNSVPEFPGMRFRHIGIRRGATMDDSIRDRFAYHRKGTRFKMQLPVSITRAGSQRVRLAAFTVDISSHGVLFACRHRLDVGGSIEYLIRLCLAAGRRP